MPTYQYRCTECGDELEVVQKFSDDPLTVCTACQGSLRKVFSPVGIVFKGSGFYRTDSRNGSGAGDKKEPAAAKAGESGAGDSAKSSANGSSSDSGSGANGSGAAKKESATSSATSAPAATGS